MKGMYMIFNGISINGRQIRLFWKRVQSLVSDKGVNTTKISLVDEGKTVTQDKKVAKTLNQYFSTAVSSLDIIENKSLLTETENLEDPVEIAIKKFENDLSVLSIKETININELFQFSEITSEEILSEINNLDNKKVVSYKNIPTKILEESPEISCEYMTKICNEQAIMQKKFPK